MKLRNLVFVVMLLCCFAGTALAAQPQAQEYSVITTEELKNMLDAGKINPLIFDARTPEEYEEVHIKGAISLPISKLERDPALLQGDLARPLVFYCNGVKCGKSKKAAKLAAGLGYQHVLVYSEGMPVWEEKGLPIYAGPNYEAKIETKRLDPAALKTLLESGAGTFQLVDVRDKNEYDEGHIPGAINIPAAAFAAGSKVLDKEKKIIVYCNSGGRSYNAYRKLTKLGYGNINQALLADWQAAGFPVSRL